MRRRARGERSPLNAEINVVSLIDVMMLLMVIFMITAPIMQGGVDVKLPKADASPLESKGGLVVSITRDGSIFAGETKMNLKTFRLSFKGLAKKQGKDGVYLRADQNVSYGIVAQVLSIIQAAGVTNLGFVTEPEEVVK
jgi:biopolymer transport protein ExbD/biopolymer transport protein TolR